MTTGPLVIAHRTCPNHAAENSLAYRNGEQLASGAALIAFLYGTVVAQKHNADFALFKVQGDARHAIGEIDHFVERNIGKAFHLGHAVTDLADGADIGFFDGCRDVGDLLFEFLEDAAHIRRR